MKIGFFGTPEIAAFCLKRLCDEHEIVFVATGTDKPTGRRQQIQINPVKKYAIQNNIPVIQPEDLDEKSFVEDIQTRGADIFVVVAYGKILPEKLFNIPRFKTINLHPSLLPRYRGAAPIQWSLINGDNITGITVQQMNNKLDAGDILLCEKAVIDQDMTSHDLENLLLPIGIELLNKSIHMLSIGKASPVNQEEEDACYCGKIDREIARIDWNKTSLEIHNLVRGLNPKPVAWTQFRGKNVKIWKTRTCNEKIDIKLISGQLIKFQKKRLITGTGDGFIEIMEIQPETKKVMEAGQFINGYRLVEGDLFEF